jgi:hypothetical protein
MRNEAIKMIDEAAAKAQKKLQCLSMMAKSGSVFRICQKIKREGQDHIECCLKIINKFKEYQ